MNILALTRYDSLGASSRYRFYQFFPFLKENGCFIDYQPLLNNNYIRYLYYGYPLPVKEIITSYIKRIYLLLLKNKYDLIWLQQEVFPWIPSWIEQLLVNSKIPVVVDYDDAFFHRYDLNKSKLVRIMLGHKIDSVMHNANVVIVGNEYLAERAQINNSKNVKILPTVIDLDRYKLKSLTDNKKFVVGWIGSPKNTKYLQEIENVFNYFKESEFHFVFIGVEKMRLASSNITFKRWDENNEVDEILDFDVGIMPLRDDPWERGKCGFKIIQYMACGIPVIASPVGVNNKIVEHNVNGFLACSEDDWIKYLWQLKNNLQLRKSMGENGRKKIEEQYSTRIIAPQLLKIFKQTLI